MNSPLYVVTGAGGGTGGVSRQVVEALRSRGDRVRALVHHDDERAEPLHQLGAEVVVGDLTEPQDVVDAIAGADRMFFSMSVSPDYLKATTIICEAALEYGHLEALVDMSQMTVSQMTLTSVGESRQHRLHYLAEHVVNWSGVPVVHVRPTVFWTIRSSPGWQPRRCASEMCWLSPSGPAEHHRSRRVM